MAADSKFLGVPLTTADKDLRNTWAQATAMLLVDRALAASERSGGPLPNAHQVSLVRDREARLISLAQCWRRSAQAGSIYRHRKLEVAEPAR